MLLILVGISGSGKSTWAHEYIKTHPNTVIVNRDKIREMLFGYTEASISEYYLLESFSAKEKLVTQAQNEIIRGHVLAGQDVIIDNTNLDAKYIRPFLKFPTEVKYKLFNLPVEICIHRDSKRVRKVGEKVILKQHEKFKKLVLPAAPERPTINNPTDKLCGCYVFDIDGTLASHTRSPYDYSKLDTDQPIWPVIHILQELEESDFDIYISTGRPDKYRTETQQWLHKYNIDFIRLYMRPTEMEHHFDFEVKREHWKDIIKTRQILGIFDDRRQIIDDARSFGFKVFQVEEGNY